MGIISFLKRHLEKTSFRYADLRPYFENKKGVEIGGPSPIFNANGDIPVYRVMKSLDGVNFSADTVWTGKKRKNRGFFINYRRRGNLYITDATDLSPFTGKSYDFVLSSNNIEHIANPLLAVEQWLSKLSPGGVLLLIAPRKESNFDHRRETVDFAHLEEDYRMGTTEKDLTHLEGILALHDLALDPKAGTSEQFRQRSLLNFENRCLHQHVFDGQTMEKICAFFGLTIIKVWQTEKEYTIVAQKPVASLD